MSNANAPKVCDVVVVDFVDGADRAVFYGASLWAGYPCLGSTDDMEVRRWPAGRRYASNDTTLIRPNQILGLYLPLRAKAAG